MSVGIKVIQKFVRKNITYVSPAEVVVVVRVADAAVVLKTLVSPGDHLIENVEVSLPRVLINNPRLLQEKIGNHSPCRLTSVEQNLNILALKIVFKVQKSVSVVCASTYKS